MSTSAITSTSSSNTSTTTSSSSNTLIDFESFLSLLTTELKYQDPTEPVSSTEFVSQMAQLSSLTQLNNINNSLGSSQAYSLLGKTVSYQTTDSSGNTVTVSGTVDSVVTSSGSSYLVIDGTKVELSSIVQVDATGE